MEILSQFPQLSLLQEHHPSLRGVLFDMDGTLFQTEPLHALVFQELARDFNVKIPNSNSDLDHSFRGMTDAQVLAIASKWAGFPQDLDTATFIHLKNQKLIELISQSNASDWHAQEMQAFLEEIKAKQLLLGLVTSSEKVVTEALLGHAQLTPLFDLIITLQDVTHPKPHPMPYLKAMQQLNIGPRETLIFEDSATGLAAARASGSRTIHAKWWP
jgi:HAD superfamily hydrolase (TIGR01509 family)